MPKGFWKHQFSEKGRHHIDDETLQAYLDIINFASGFFSEEELARDIMEARTVMWAKGFMMCDKAEAWLLSSWLNFANGGVEWDEMINTDFFGKPDYPFYEVMNKVECILSRENPRFWELLQAKLLCLSVNLSDIF